ncbi:hypothetical protein CHS0354_026027 [Potamilus streckersoni]|uniref:Uncharacterized protein n=1 Tax=Potamilus streckersoni TaxID=2493646 RepID=A0AAE0SBL5_9BIVA|nr:hypothetical protein CHS0354_026027 [Potamilus streckersoni]
MGTVLGESDLKEVNRTEGLDFHIKCSTITSFLDIFIRTLTRISPTDAYTRQQCRTSPAVQDYSASENAISIAQRLKSILMSGQTGDQTSFINITYHVMPPVKNN